MSFGKMNCFVELISTEPVKDADGFSKGSEHHFASVRAYKEDRYGTVKWANLAAFSSATCLFRFRRIPNAKITPAFLITCGDERYRILSAEDVRGRGMYVEVLAEKLEGVARHGKG